MSPRVSSAKRPFLAGLVVAGALFLVYVLTLAPDVTFWDAGEFVAAGSSFGIPHPPGTPLYVLLVRTAVLVAGSANPAVALALLSAMCTAVACAVGGTLVARWLESDVAGIAAGVCSGTASSVWLSATEPEVYSVSLLLVALTLWSGDRAGRSARADGAVTLTAYLVGLAAPLHLGALVVAPGAAVLADGGEWTQLPRGLLLAACGVATLGVATGSVAVAGAGFLGLAALGLVHRPSARATALAMLALLVAFSALVVLLLRARHDPAINQGNPSTFAALVEVVGRRQYPHPGFWPRQAPLWLQLANVAQYADWQFGIALAPDPMPSVARTIVTAVFVALGYVGAGAHRRADVRSWRALVVVAVGASVGVALYLNLKAGSSIGWGILPDSAPHEARERDYFYVVAFWAWGLWAGAGAVHIASSYVRRGGAALGLVLASLPIILNWAAMDRGRQPAAALPRAVATALLTDSPRRSVLFSGGDNDSYPLWYAQQSLHMRADVTVITTPMLPAAWYRAELARRHGLVAAADTGGAWRGEAALLHEIANRARSAGRPVVAAVTLEPARRAALGSNWSFDGLLYRERAPCARSAVVLDREAARAHTARLSAVLTEPLHSHADPAARYMGSMLQCAAAVGRATHDRVADSLLASRCGLR